MHIALRKAITAALRHDVDFSDVDLRSYSLFHKTRPVVYPANDDLTTVHLGVSFVVSVKTGSAKHIAEVLMRPRMGLKKNTKKSRSKGLLSYFWSHFSAFHLEDLRH